MLKYIRLKESKQKVKWYLTVQFSMKSARIQQAPKTKLPNFVTNIDQLKDDVRTHVHDFLLNPKKKLLLVKTKEIAELMVLFPDILQRFWNERNIPQEKPKSLLRDYIGWKNQTFLPWEKLLAEVNNPKVWPALKNLMICEVPLTIPLEQQVPVMDKLEQIAAIDVFKKIIIISSTFSDLHKFMRTTKEIRNEFTATNLRLRTPQPIRKSTVEQERSNPILFQLALNGRFDIISSLIDVPKICIDLNERSSPDGKTALHAAAEAGHANIVSLLIRHGAGKNVIDFHRYTPLHLAVRRGHEDVVRALAKNKVELNSTVEDRLTALHLAARNGNDKIIEILLKHGAFIDAQDADGMTALHYASFCCHNTVIETLVKHGADVNMTRRDGATALHRAVAWNYYQTVETLVNYGARVNVKDMFGEAPLDIAKSERVRAFLISNGAKTETVDSAILIERSFYEKCHKSKTYKSDNLAYYH